MTIFRFSFGLAAFVAAGGVAAQGFDLTPRTPLEAVVLGEPETAKAHLTALARSAATDRAALVDQLLAAGFAPDRGTADCDFYGYHRRTTADGAARGVQVILCPTREPMVLVFDFFAPGKIGPSFQEAPKEKRP